MNIALTKLPSPVLILGAAHAGKSNLGMQGLAPDQPALVIATGDPQIEDLWLRQRIDELKNLRPAAWDTLETNRDLTAALAACLIPRGPQARGQVLIDSLNQWLAALILREQQESSDQHLSQQEHALSELEELVRRAGQSSTRLVLISSEGGAGPAPARATERLYRQSLGQMNQRLAQVCKSVVYVTAGIPQLLKG